MGTEIGSLEERLKSLLEQLKAECAVFERIVYKNKNQHRRSSYFQYLLKVRRDLRLLQSANLEEILGCCFLVITGKKPKQKLHLLESLKWSKCDCGVPNFMERILGAARLLSQSFFMGFSLTVLALLARLRILVQQVLLDVVSAFNMVSSLSQKKQSVNITQEGIEVFRDYYPTNREFITLECTWETDKFVLLERTHKNDLKSQDGVLGDASVKASAVQYKSISFLGDDFDVENMNEDNTAKESSTRGQEDKKDLCAGPSRESGNRKEEYGGIELGENPVNLGNQDEKLSAEGSLLATSSLSTGSMTLSQESSAKAEAFVSVKRSAPSTAAFISVKRPATSTTNIIVAPSEEAEKDSSSKEDSFFNLLTGGRLKDSLF